MKFTELNLKPQILAALKKMEYVDPASGRYDHGYNPLAMLEDLFIPISGTEDGTRVDKIFGSQNTNDVTDLLYYIRKFCAAVRVPPEFLGFIFSPWVSLIISVKL